MPELLGRHEIDLPPEGPKANKLLSAKHVHPRGFVLNCAGQNSYLYRPNLVCSPRFRRESVFNTQLTMLIWCFIPQFVFYTSVCVLYPVCCLQFAVHGPCFILIYTGNLQIIQDHANNAKDACCSVVMRNNVLLLPKLRQFFCLGTWLALPWL